MMVFSQCGTNTEHIFIGTLFYYTNWNSIRVAKFWAKRTVWFRLWTSKLFKQQNVIPFSNKNHWLCYHLRLPGAALVLFAISRWQRWRRSGWQSSRSTMWLVVFAGGGARLQLQQYTEERQRRPTVLWRSVIVVLHELNTTRGRAPARFNRNASEKARLLWSPTTS